MEKRDRELLEITLLEQFKKLVDKTLFYAHKEEILCEEDIDSYINDNENKRQGIYSILSELSKDRTEEETLSLIEKINVKLSMYEASRIKEYLMNSEFSIFKEDIDKFISSIEKRFLEVEEAIDEVKPTIVIESTEVLLPSIEDEESSEDPLGNTTKLLKIIDDRIKVLEEEAKDVVENEEINFFKKDDSKLEQPTENDINNLFDPIKSESEPNNKETEEDMDAFELSKKISESMNTKLSREEIDGFIQKIDDKLAELEREEQALNTTKIDIPVE